MYNFYTLSQSLSQSLPCGPGLLYTKNGTNFKMVSMRQVGKKSSIASLEWLEYQQATNPYKTVIKHAYNFGEQLVAGHHVDGYTEIPDGDRVYKIVFEYLFGFDLHGSPGLSGHPKSFTLSDKKIVIKKLTILGPGQPQ